nr:class I tRNA ligase family protein [Planctomycetota bacterium]
ATADIHMSYLYPWDGVVDTPFGSGWAIVGPGETSQRHMHHEGETWFIVEGRGRLTQDGAAREVGPGDVVYLAPFTEHELHNPSASDRVVFLTVWWQDMQLASRHAADTNGKTNGSTSKPRRVAVNVAPPTPNGDLHLGHLSGPYLGADVLTRYLRLTGADARYVMATDDFQSYVQGKALQMGETPEAIADGFAAKIAETLAMAGIHVDEFTRPMHAEGYVETIQDVFRALYDAGHIVAKDDEVLVAPEDARVLFEVYVGGHCPHCGASAGGGGCEECGRPNAHVDLTDPTSSFTAGTPERKTIRRLVVPMAPHAERLRAFVADATMPVHLRALAERLIEAGLPDVPATWPHAWGIPCPIEGFEGQVVSSWLELGHGFLDGVRRYGSRAGWTTEDGPLTPAADTELVQFFGFDNGFYYALLYPLLFQLVDPDFEPPATFVCNEFYRLDGLKFSTSRGHAIWIRDIVQEVPADLVRFYVCHTRPETEQTSFTREAFDTFVEEELQGTWLEWLRALGSRVAESFDGRAPEPGFWTRAHERHLAFLERTTEAVHAAYAPDPFSTQAVTRALIELVRRTRSLAAAEAHWADAPDRSNEYRTAIALELLSARTLAQLVAPIMPVFAERLWSALGLEGDLATLGFDAECTFVAAGTAITLDDFEIGRP